MMRGMWGPRSVFGGREPAVVVEGWACGGMVWMKWDAIYLTLAARPADTRGFVRGVGLKYPGSKISETLGPILEIC